MACACARVALHSARLTSRAPPRPIARPPVPEPTDPPRAHLVWAPEPDLEELEGYGAYLKFANSRGLHHHHDGRFKTGDTEVRRFRACS